MPAIKKSVRLLKATQNTCHNLSTAYGEVNWSGSINALAAQFEILVADNTPKLTDQEWNAFYCLYNGYFPSQNYAEEARKLWWHVSEGYQYDEQIKYFIGSEEDAIALIDRVKKWSISEQLAVIYKAQSYWTTEFDE